MWCLCSWKPLIGVYFMNLSCFFGICIASIMSCKRECYYYSTTSTKNKYLYTGPATCMFNVHVLLLLHQKENHHSLFAFSETLNIYGLLLYFSSVTFCPGQRVPIVVALYGSCSRLFDHPYCHLALRTLRVLHCALLRTAAF